jgi:hypothetical protein
VILQDLALILAGWFVLSAAVRLSGWRAGPAVATGLYLGLLCFHFGACFQNTHDCWLLLALLTVMIVLTDRLWGRSPGLAAAAGWGAFGGFAALAGPVLGLTWGALTAALAVSARRVRPFTISILLAVLVTSPWVARNYWVFHRFIPVKSNLFYELYQSNCLEPDGLLRLETGRNHPYRTAGEERSRYKDLGEIEYLDGFRRKFLDATSADPIGYLAKVGNRLVAATILYSPYSESEEGWTLWTFYVIHPLPFYGLLLMLLGGGWSVHRLKIISIIVYLVYLLPYVLVAYYERYSLPLVGVQALFCLWGLEAIIDSLRPARRGRDGQHDRLEEDRQEGKQHHSDQAQGDALHGASQIIEDQRYVQPEPDESRAESRSGIVGG